MGPVPSQPGASAHGKADLALYLDGESDEVSLAVSSSWWTADGQCREASLQLAGDTGEAYDLLQEANLWVWKRWKKPIAEHDAGPFDERQA